jgi:hypothetical protein
VVRPGDFLIKRWYIAVPKAGGALPMAIILFILNCQLRYATKAPSSALFIGIIDLPAMKA